MFVLLVLFLFLFLFLCYSLKRYVYFALDEADEGDEVGEVVMHALEHASFCLHSSF